MNETLKFTGGVKIGLAHASWPLATLTVTKDRLELNGSLIGNCSFLPDDIIALKAEKGFFFSNAIQILHNVPNYSKTIYFFTGSQNPQEVINYIKDETDFFDNKNLDNSIVEIIRQRQQQGSFPMKPAWAIGIGLVYVILFGIEGLTIDMTRPPQPIYSTIGIGLVLLVTFTLLMSERVRKIILKPQRKLEDIKAAMVFIALLFSFIFIGFSLASFLVPR